VILTGVLRVVSVRMTSTMGGIGVVKTVVSEVVVGKELMEELTMTRVMVMEVSRGKILVLLISGNRVESQSPEAWSSVDELVANTDSTRGTSTEMLDT
jgi:hypothetical protein